MTTNETCPYCRSERTASSWFKQYRCGTIHGASVRSPRCYEIEIAAKDTEIERLKQAVLDEREACVEVCKRLSKDRGCFVEEVLNEAVEAIRAKGEVK
jgi:hypothetical protein